MANMKGVLKFTVTSVASAVLITYFTPAVSNADDVRRVIVSLGDSYSSGEGIEPFYCQDLIISERVQEEDWLAHRSERSWSAELALPGLGSMHGHRDENWYFAASSGAKIENLYEEQEKEYSFEGFSGVGYIAPQLDIFDEIYVDPDYVTVTLGGNDAGFEDIVSTGAIYGTYFCPGRLSDQLNNAWDEFFEEDGIRDRLYQAYHDISAAAGPDAMILVVGYPPLLNRDGSGVLFNADEAHSIDSSISLFNSAISDLVEECSNEGMNIRFVSVQEAFNGHEAYTDDPYINPIIVGPEDQDLDDRIWVTRVSPYSMHPNEAGARAYARCVQEIIDEFEL